jgi:hypothetical protein
MKWKKTSLKMSFVFVDRLVDKILKNLHTATTQEYLIACKIIMDFSAKLKCEQLYLQYKIISKCKSAFAIFLNRGKYKT